jgi:nicotinamidase-related amidase
MPFSNENLHGGRPVHSPTVLLLIDVINDFEFEGADRLLEHALPMARRLAAFKKKARAAGCAVIYVNDNFGQWQSDFKQTVGHCCDKRVRGHVISRKLKPGRDDYFVLKPRHSGFFATTLDVLLDYLEARTLIICGLASNICVLFTANDGYMRGYKIMVPGDCSAAEHAGEHQFVLSQMAHVLKANITPSTELNLKSLHRKRKPS